MMKKIFLFLFCVSYFVTNTSAQNRFVVTPSGDPQTGDGCYQCSQDIDMNPVGSVDGVPETQWIGLAFYKHNELNDLLVFRVAKRPSASSCVISCQSTFVEQGTGYIYNANNPSTPIGTASYQAGDAYVDITIAESVFTATTTQVYAEVQAIGAGGVLGNRYRTAILSLEKVIATQKLATPSVSSVQQNGNDLTVNGSYDANASVDRYQIAASGTCWNSQCGLFAPLRSQTSTLGILSGLPDGNYSFSSRSGGGGLQTSNFHEPVQFTVSNGVITTLTVTVGTITTTSSSATIPITSVGATNYRIKIYSTADVQGVTTDANGFVGVNVVQPDKTGTMTNTVSETFAGLNAGTSYTILVRTSSATQTTGFVSAGFTTAGSTSTNVQIAPIDCIVLTTKPIFQLNGSHTAQLEVEHNPGQSSNWQMHLQRTFTGIQLAITDNNLFNAIGHYRWRINVNGNWSQWQYFCMHQCLVHGAGCPVSQGANGNIITLSNNQKEVTISNISILAGDLAYYEINVPENSFFVVKTREGTGNPSLYVKYGAYPEPYNQIYDVKSVYKGTTNANNTFERIRIDDMEFDGFDANGNVVVASTVQTNEQGRYFIAILAQNDCVGIELVVRYEMFEIPVAGDGWTILRGITAIHHEGIDFTKSNCKILSTLSPGSARTFYVNYWNGVPGISLSNPNPDTDPYGNSVYLDYGDGYFSISAHLDQIDLGINIGSVVGANTILGTVGNTGNVQSSNTSSQEPGTHLHFEPKKVSLKANKGELELEYGDVHTSTKLPRVPFAINKMWNGTQMYSNVVSGTVDGIVPTGAMNGTCSASDGNVMNLAPNPVVNNTVTIYHPSTTTLIYFYNMQGFEQYSATAQSGTTQTVIVLPSTMISQNYYCVILYGGNQYASFPFIKN